MVFNLTWLMLAAILVAPPEQPPTGSVMDGRITVQRRCVGCHNSAATGRSIYAAAPPLRTLGGRHTPESLQRTLAQPSPEGHYGMPILTLTPQEARDVVAYIDALAEADRKTRRRLALPPGPIIR